jgi:hypothetical protein
LVNYRLEIQLFRKSLLHVGEPRVRELLTLKAYAGTADGSERSGGGKRRHGGRRAAHSLR